MSIKAGVGVDSGSDSFIATKNAAQVAVTSLGSDPDLFIVFASSVYDSQHVLKGLRSVSADAHIIGSSTAGEITTHGPTNKNSVAVMAIKSDTVNFFTGVGQDIQVSPFAAGKAAAMSVKKSAGDALKAFIMIPDVLTGNGAETVRGVLSALGAHFPVVGGASGDDFKFVKTYQYCEDSVYSGACVGLGMSGEFSMGIGVKHGWLPIGLPMKVTRSEGAVLHEIDGKPAISLYEDYFGEEKARELRTQTLAKLAITYPIGMNKEGSDELLIVDPLSVDANGSITCAAEVPTGADIRLMIGSSDEAIAIAKVAAEDALKQLNGKKPQAIIIFNCIARQRLFGVRAGEEISAIQSVLGLDTPLIGFYTYGEQAPLGGEVRNIEKCNPSFHNETVVILALGD